MQKPFPGSMMARGAQERPPPETTIPRQMNDKPHETSSRHEIKALTGLRGVAASLIVLHHLGLLMLPLGTTVLAPPCCNADCWG